MKESNCIIQDERFQTDSLISGQCFHFTKFSDFGVSFLISGLVTISFKTLVAPLERIKLILQTQANSQQMANAHKNYTGVLNALIRIPQEQGFLSLWRGNFINLCRYFPSEAINFSFYDIYYQMLIQIVQPKTIESLSVLSFLAGGAVGITSCILLYPLAFCTTRISVDVGDSKMIKREFRNVNDCFYKVSKADGYRGFYQGLAISILGTFVYRSVYFGVYTTGKHKYLDHVQEQRKAEILNKPPFFVTLAFAQIASTMSILVAYPFDTIARQKMLRSGHGRDSHLTVREMIGKILIKEGPIGFYRGIFANLLMSFSGSFILVSYDFIKSFYRRYRLKSKAKK